MSNPLRLLIVEDSLPDYLLTLRTLELEGWTLETRRVDRLETLRQALNEETWEAVVSDYSLPGLPFREVLAEVQARAPGVPLVIFSGSVGEEEAVSLLKAGVRDFVLKDRPGRLPKALHNALQEAREHREALEAAEALVASEARFTATFDQAAIGMAQVGLDGHILKVNHRLCEILGYSQEELLGLSSRDLSPPDYAARTLAMIQDLLQGKRSTYTEEKPNIRKDGSIVWISLSVSLVRGPQGAPDYLVCVVEDIQRRKAAEAEVQTWLGAFTACTHGIALGGGASGLFKACNPAFARLLGRSAEEVVGADIAETFAPAWRPHLKDWAVEVERMGHIQFRAQMLRKGGEVFPVEVDLVALPGEDGRMDLGVATVQDITAQLAGEKELQDAAAMLRSIMDSISPMLAVVDGQGAIIHSNEAWKRFCPSPSGSVLGMGANLLQRLEETLPEGEGAGITQSLRRLAETEDGHFETEFAWESRWLHMGATGLRGSLKGLVIILTDITARRHSDSALKASEERFFAIFQASPIATLLTDSAEETILDANPAFLRLSGHALKDALGHSTLELGFWMDSEVRRNAMDRIQAEGRLRNFEMSFRLASGEAGQAVVSAETAHLGGRPVTVSLFRDVTDMRSAQEKERQMERELSHLQRLESVGRLAGGVSHDMNNVLCAIMTMAELMKRDCAHSPELTRKTDLIAQAATRGRDLVKSLTDFARKEVKDAIPLDLNQLVEREAELLEHTTFKRVEIRLNLTHPLPEVLGEASALANVLMNLCVNACDAMPSGGVLSLETRHPRPDWVELIVEDTGSGMSPEVINRAMEPFFTTKPSGKGTGLGLSIVYGTVKAHGGSVEIKSAPGKGTRITLGFPTQTAPLQAPAFPWETAPGPSISMRILVVDDDELVRNTLSPLLEMLGHHVESASSGLEALRRLESGLQVERVILDLNMPGLSGLETLSRLRILQPELPVMVSTGFVDAEVEEVLRTFPNTKLLHKPFLISEFQRLLQS